MSLQPPSWYVTGWFLDWQYVLTLRLFALAYVAHGVSQPSPVFKKGNDGEPHRCARGRHRRTDPLGRRQAAEERSRRRVALVLGLCGRWFHPSRTAERVRGPCSSLWRLRTRVRAAGRERGRRRPQRRRGDAQYGLDSQRAAVASHSACGGRVRGARLSGGGGGDAQSVAARPGLHALGTPLYSVGS